MEDVKGMWRRWRLGVNARKIEKSGESWYIGYWIRFMRQFMLGPVFFRTAFPCSGGCHLEKGGMPFLIRLRLTVKRMQLLKIEEQISSIWANWCMLMIVCVIWLDKTTPPWWRGKVMLYYYYYYYDYNWEMDFLLPVTSKKSLSSSWTGSHLDSRATLSDKLVF